MREARSRRSGASPGRRGALASDSGSTCRLREEKGRNLSDPRHRLRPCAAALPDRDAPDRGFRDAHSLVESLPRPRVVHRELRHQHHHAQPLVDDPEHQVAHGHLHAPHDARDGVRDAEPGQRRGPRGRWDRGARGRVLKQWGRGSVCGLGVAPLALPIWPPGGLEHHLDVLQVHARGLRGDGRPGDVQAQRPRECADGGQGQAVQEALDIQLEVLEHEVTPTQRRFQVGRAGACGQRGRA